MTTKEPFDWSHSLSAEDAKYWRQEEVHRMNPTGEMNITPLNHTNEGEATDWTMGVDLVTAKRQQALVINSLFFKVLDLCAAAGVLSAFIWGIGSIQAALAARGQ